MAKLVGEHLPNYKHHTIHLWRLDINKGQPMTRDENDA
jgi:hypothetical protein